MINIQPVNARTLVKPLKKEELTLGSLVLPDGGNAQLEEAIAQNDFNIAGVDGLVVLVKKGEKIVYPEGEGLLQLVNGVYLRWITVTNIWGVVSETVTVDKGDSL